MRSPRIEKICAGLLVIGVMAVATACGSNDSSSTSSSSSSTPASSSGGTSTASGGGDVLGTPKAASGSPVLFGMVNLETNPNVNFPELHSSVDATVKYLNAYRGGIDGRPIKVDVCPTDGQPATTAKCANKLVSEKPVAILGGADIAGGAAFPIYARAKLAPRHLVFGFAVFFADFFSHDGDDA